MLKILFVDDDPIRHQYFAKKFTDNTKFEVTQVTLVETAMVLLQNEKWDLVFLDHDMADHEPLNEIREMYGTHKLTGQTITRFIKTLPNSMHPKEVIVHSWNIEAAIKMVQDLESVGILAKQIPFNPNYIPDAVDRSTGG